MIVGHRKNWNKRNQRKNTGELLNFISHMERQAEINQKREKE